MTKQRSPGNKQTSANIAVDNRSAHIPESTYNPQEIEAKWQKRWEETGIYQPDLDNAKKPFYNLMMFPYPSAEGLHVGSVFTFSGIDVLGRFMRMQGYDVFEPIGLDAFGIHSENYALKTNTNPMELSEKTEKNFYRQLKNIGNSFDWRHSLETNKPEYYKWTQWLFLQLYKKGLVEKKLAPVNWCPSCLTVLADEQVVAKSKVKRIHTLIPQEQKSKVGHAGGQEERINVCERCETEVETKLLSQWFFKITHYADRLLQNLDWINWEESVKTMQRNWIGKKVGAEIVFKVKSHDQMIAVFTTRPDTIFGVTAIVLAPEHKAVLSLATADQQAAVEQYSRASLKKSTIERLSEGKQKSGVFTGRFAINPISGQQVPIYVSDYIIGSFGTGAIMSVPAHDQRDFDFAKQFSLPIKVVVVENEQKLAESKSERQSTKPDRAYEEYGILINSDNYTSMSSENASEKIIVWLEENHCGYRKVTYHIRDWLISRQRYWGPPIPLIFCENCAWKVKSQKDSDAHSAGTKVKNIDQYSRGEIDNPGWIAVAEEDLPVELPHIQDFRPTGTGKSPLANHPEFYNVRCPKCHKTATRETDVSDTFLDSAWYFLRYPSTEYNKVPFDKKRTEKWLPVTSYIGGKEHTVLHLLYSRFINMVLYDSGLISFEEPYQQFRAHGLIIKDGAKMSKSKGNVISPDHYINRYGADTLRAYLLFLGPFTEGGDFRDTGIAGMHRFLNRLWRLVGAKEFSQTAPAQERQIVHKTIKKVTKDIKELHYNTAIAALMELVNFFTKQETVSYQSVKVLVQLLAPIVPYISEELWSILGGSYSVHTSSWPEFNPAHLEQDMITIVVQVSGKIRDKITVSSKATEKEITDQALASEKIKKYLNTTKPKRIIYIAKRIVNLVV